MTGLPELSTKDDVHSGDASTQAFVRRAPSHAVERIQSGLDFWHLEADDDERCGVKDAEVSVD